MNNLKKFSTEADYSAATLNYPAVSWVTATDTVHFDKAGAADNNKVKIAFTADECCQGKQIDITPNMEVVNNIDSLSVNGEPFTPGGSGTYLPLSNNTDYLIEYELKDGVTDVDNWFAIQPAEGCSSTRIKYDILFPAQVTVINSLYENGVDNLILEATTPPTGVSMGSDIPNIYVPDSAVNTYKSATGWSELISYIFPISEYSGDIPV